FHLSLQFESTTPNTTFSAHPPIKATGVATPPLPEMLTAATGTRTLTANYDDLARNSMLKRPVRVKVYLHEATGEATSRVVAATEWIEFR
ncbi:MAG TPA: hypothetical protein VM733_03085, partial [Thermoanaerobaculia bacterium]|nr:hypothetical protein [Thermoanaerobaculia bacterium]